jgi:hypothetical protein
MATLKRKPKNLFLDPAAVARGERYSRLHGTNLSRLVDDFLVTRNPRDFAGAPVELRSAGEITAMLGAR